MKCKDVHAKVFKEDFVHWGEGDFIPNRFDCIFLASSKVKYDLMIGAVRDNRDILGYSYAVVDEIKALRQQLLFGKDEEKILARQSINKYVEIARHIAIGKEISEPERYSFATEENNNLDFSADMELLEKEMIMDKKKEE